MPVFAKHCLLSRVAEADDKWLRHLEFVSVGRSAMVGEVGEVWEVF